MDTLDAAVKEKAANEGSHTVLKGEQKMSKSKKTAPGFMPLPPMWGWFGDVDEYKEKWDDFKSTVDTFWDQMIEMQKTSMEAWKEQWDKFFPQLMEMQDNFIASLPDELTAMPGMPAIKPKKVMEKVKEFQETANKHAVEQADARIDFVVESQQQVKEAVKYAVESIEEKVEEVKEKVEEKVEEVKEKIEEKAEEKPEKTAGENVEKPAADEKPKTAKPKAVKKSAAKTPSRKRQPKAAASDAAENAENKTADAPAAEEPKNE